MMRHVFALLLVTALALVGCAAPGTATCQEQIKPYAAIVGPLLTEWQDAVKLAGSAPRVSLATQIASLQEIRRRTATTVPPDCAKEAHGHLVKGMDLGIQSFLDFLTQKPQTAVNQEFTDAATELATFSAQMANLAQGSADR
jgi:hypothetical protein